jgi:hypothetical protein
LPQEVLQNIAIIETLASKEGNSIESLAYFEVLKSKANLKPQLEPIQKVL